MKRKVNIVILLLLSIVFVNSQVLNKEYIDNRIICDFPDALINDSILYVINGIASEGNKVDSIASSYTIQDIKDIIYVDSAALSKTILCKSHAGIIVITTDKEKNKKRYKNKL